MTRIVKYFQILSYNVQHLQSPIFVCAFLECRAKNWCVVNITPSFSLVVTSHVPFAKGLLRIIIQLTISNDLYLLRFLMRKETKKLPKQKTTF